MKKTHQNIIRKLVSTVLAERMYLIIYWKTNMIRHNLDVMHIEKNVFDNLFNTLMCVPNKTKDHIKARHDLRELGIRSELHYVSACTINSL